MENVMEEIYQISTLRGLSFAKKYEIPVTVKTPIMEINKNGFFNIKKYCFCYYIC